MNRFVAALACLFFFFGAKAQICDSLSIIIRTDKFSNETSWRLSNLTKDSVIAQRSNQDLENDSFYESKFCLDPSYCFQIELFDSFGDGLQDPGFYQILLNGQVLREGSGFGFLEAIEINCGPGSTCTNAILITEGQYAIRLTEPWFVFTPLDTGSYTISTCGLNDCDTQLWVYDNCEGLVLSQDQAGSIYFDDNEGGCGQQAQITQALLEPGQQYYLRLGSAGNNCLDSIYFKLQYNGPIKGCTRAEACNFNPFANVDDGSCLMPGHPDCPGAPDLSVSQIVLRNSIFLDTINNIEQCAIEEACLRGYGRRDILRFSTHIANEGQQDYYVGKLSDNRGQFNADNCHGHLHYENYAEYILFDEFGRLVPVGFKNGFCLTDLSCNEGIEKKYHCGNMGLTAGCQDVYLSDLDCQWIDVTDLIDGNYILAIRINWNEQPDLLGRNEENFSNNWAQVCFRLYRENGILKFQIEDSCVPYSDCSGQLYGRAIPDCKGVCNGISRRGDLDENLVLSEVDLDHYLEAVVLGDLQAESCYELHRDGKISIFDAALLQNCLLEGSDHEHGPGVLHDHCNFPAGIDNPHDTAFIFIKGFEREQKYFDMELLLPQSGLKAFQLQLTGMEISEVQNLSGLAVDLQYNPGNGAVAGIFSDNLGMSKQASKQSFLRFHYEGMLADSICLESDLEMIDLDLERISAVNVTHCIAVSGSVSTFEPRAAINYKLYPNPSSKQAIFSIERQNDESYFLQISNLSGQQIRHFYIRENTFVLNTGSLARGIYYFRLYNSEKSVFGKLMVQ